MKPATLVMDIADDGAPVMESADVDLLRSEAGSWYRVVDVVQVRSSKHARRVRYSVERLGRWVPSWADLNGQRVLHFHWNSRG